MAERIAAPRVVREILDKVTLKPARFGGSDFGDDEFVSQVCELAAHDGSLGWLAAMFNAASCEVSTLPDVVVDAVWGANPNAVVTIAHQGSGAVNPDGQLTGEWKAVVGAEYADWLVLPTIKDRVLVPREAAHIEPTIEPSGLGAAGIGDVTIAQHPVADGHTYPGDQRVAAVAMAGAAAAVTGSADGVWRRHVEQMRARLATTYSGDELANAAPAQVGRVASDIDATKLQIIEALRRPDAEASLSWAYEQAVARARAAADRLLGNSRHALDLNDPATRLWGDVHAGCRLATAVFGTGAWPAEA